MDVGQEKRSKKSKGYIHEAFSPAPGGGMQCNYCHKIISGTNVTRMKKHLLEYPRCKFLDSDAARVCGDPEVEMARGREQAIDPQQQQQANPLRTPSGNIARPRGRPPNSERDSETRDRLSRSEQDKIEVALCRALVENSIPFNVVESESFVAFLKVVRPTFQPPTRWRMAGEVLLKVYQDVLDEIHKKQNVPPGTCRCGAYTPSGSASQPALTPQMVQMSAVAGLLNFNDPPSFTSQVLQSLIGFHRAQGSSLQPGDPPLPQHHSQHQQQ